MKEVTVTGGQLIRARQKAIEMGRLANSITNGAGNLAGFIGEVVVADELNAKHDNTYDYDLTLNNTTRVDVKTKRCNSKPLDTYDCSISAHGTKQKCDMYIFVRVLNDFSKAWILGKLGKEEYFDRATFFKKGMVAPDNGFRFRADCYNVKINMLESIDATHSVS